MKEHIRILVADDHPIVRDGLVAILHTQADFRVIGQASNGLDVIDMAETLTPDVILLDLEMPGLDGVGALKKMQLADSNIKVIVFTAYDTDERILNAIQSGAKGYLLKGAPRKEIFKAIRLVSQGESLLQPIIASKIIQHVASLAKQEKRTNLATPLTNREQEVILLLAQGKTNKEIGEELVITERTVKHHVSSILRKLDATNRTEAVNRAARLRILEI